ncbi:hypothetical protein ACPCG0_02245 [Propionibacteriaceae bacterium Y1923]|uniref:hypothetical protein n=1 Tax=Aestuariimicrobium sp. Y1814 TaxID=3418742 RepID=UPI003C1CD60C
MISSMKTRAAWLADACVVPTPIGGTAHLLRAREDNSAVSEFGSALRTPQQDNSTDSPFEGPST